MERDKHLILPIEELRAQYESLRVFRNRMDARLAATAFHYRVGLEGVSGILARALEALNAGDVGRLTVALQDLQTHLDDNLKERPTEEAGGAS